MSSPTKLTRRLEIVTRTQAEHRITRLIETTANHIGIDPADLRTEAERLAQRFADAGIVTHDEKVAYVANELGITIDELARKLEGGMRCGSR